MDLVGIAAQEAPKPLTIGMRFFGDGAYFMGGSSEMRPGLAITNARFRATFRHGAWFVFADCDFAYGRFSQKDLYVRYRIDTPQEVQHDFVFGYYMEPSSMSRNAGDGALHFMSMPAPILALAPGRALGFSYRVRGSWYYADQGVFTPDLYNAQATRGQRWAVSGRWLLRWLCDAGCGAHVGVNARYLLLPRGSDADGTLRSVLVYKSPLENKVDTRWDGLRVEVPWTRSTVGLGVEALLVAGHFFARWERLCNWVRKTRNDEQAFVAQGGKLDTPGALAAWIDANPFATSRFRGTYVEMGYQITGPGYSYNSEKALLGNSRNSGTLEVVARYSYTNLNSIYEGDVYRPSLKRYTLPGGGLAALGEGRSVAGGVLHATTLGVNYAVTNHVKLMASYLLGNMQHPAYPSNSWVHAFQGRVSFTF